MSDRAVSTVTVGALLLGSRLPVDVAVARLPGDRGLLAGPAARGSCVLVARVLVLRRVAAR